MVHLEVTLTGRSKSFTEETLQECVIKFFNEYGEATKEVVKCLTFETKDPEQFMSIGGNESCIGWLKQMQQGVIDDK